MKILDVFDLDNYKKIGKIECESVKSLKEKFDISEKFYHEKIFDCLDDICLDEADIPSFNEFCKNSNIKFF